MILGRNIGQDQTTCRIQVTTLAFLLLALSPFVVSDSDYPLEYFDDTW